MIDTIRKAVRPTLALSAWLTVLVMVYQGRPVPAELWTLVAVLSAFYFAERANRNGNP